MVLHRDKNVATYIYFPLVDANGAVVVGSANPDSEWEGYADGTVPNGWTDCTNEATEIGGSGWYYLLLTSTEMNNDYVAVQIKSDDALTQCILIETKVKEAIDTVDGVVDSILVDTGTTIPGTITTMQGNVTDILTDTGTTLDGKLNTIDTVVDAIKAKTDNLPADPASDTNVDANETKIDTAITDIAAVKADTAAILIDTDTMEADLKTHIDTAETSLTAEIDANETKIDTIDTNVDSILTDTGTTLDGLIKELGGLANKNIYIDTTTFDGDGNMTGCRVRMYDSAANATTHGAGGLLYTLTVVATYTSGNLTSYLATLA